MYVTPSADDSCENDDDRMCVCCVISNAIEFSHNFFDFFLFQLKKLTKQKPKISDETNVDSDELSDDAAIAEEFKFESSPANCQPLDEKMYEYVQQQNKLAKGAYAAVSLGDSSSDEHTSENKNETSSSGVCVDECDGSVEIDVVEKSDEHGEGKENAATNDSDDFIDDSDSDDDDSFGDLMNQHFERSAARPTIVSAQNDLDDSEPIEKDVKFFIDKCRSTAMVECDGTEYRIGFLDLTAAESARMEMFSQDAVYLTVKSNHIMIRDNRFHIKRITEREIAPNKLQAFDSMYEKLQLGRVQFGTESFFAKYQNEVYFVGEKLYHEYSELLKRTKKCPGTAIRIGHDRLIIDDAMQTLDVLDSISFQNEICVISGTFDMYKFQDEYPLTGFQRFMICKNPWQLLQVEPELLHSSIYDDCTEIYAESNFPCAESKNVEKIVRPAKVAKQAKKSEQRFKDEE